MAEAGIENQIPGYVDETILACLSRVSIDRPQSAAEVWQRLTQSASASTAVPGEKPSAATVSKPVEPAMPPSTPPAPSVKKQRTSRPFMVVAVIVLIMLLSGWWVSRNKASQKPGIVPLQPAPAIINPPAITKNLEPAPTATNAVVPAKPVHQRVPLIELADVVHAKGWETNATTPELQTAATAGEVDAMTELGNRAHAATNYTEAVRWYQKGCDATNANAEVKLGRMYLSGQGVDKDAGEALKRFQIAADQKNAAAEIEIGSMYQSGVAVAKDYPEAQRWYRKAAEQGDATGETRLGSMYQLGLGINKDYAWKH